MTIEIVDFPIQNGDFPVLCESLPEGMFMEYIVTSCGFWTFFWSSINLQLEFVGGKKGAMVSMAMSKKTVWVTIN